MPVLLRMSFTGLSSRAQNGAKWRAEFENKTFLVLTFTICFPQKMPKYDYNTVEDNNSQNSVQLKSGRCLKLSDKICLIFYRSL